MLCIAHIAERPIALDRRAAVISMVFTSSDEIVRVIIGVTIAMVFLLFVITLLEAWKAYIVAQNTAKWSTATNIAAPTFLWEPDRKFCCFLSHCASRQHQKRALAIAR